MDSLSLESFMLSHSPEAPMPSLQSEDALMGPPLLSIPPVATTSTTTGEVFRSQKIADNTKTPYSDATQVSSISTIMYIRGHCK